MTTIPVIPDAAPEGGIKSVRMAFDLLEFLAERGGALGVTELAGRLGTPKARIYRHLRTLVDAGYVEQEPQSGRYRATIKLYVLGQAMADNLDFVSAARAQMRPLRDRLGHTVTASKHEAGEIVVIEMIRGTSVFEIAAKVGARFPFHATAQGKLGLAYGSPQFAEAIYASKLEPYTEATITRPERLRKEVDDARRLGWAVAPEETIRGVNALAAPIFGSDGALVGTIALVDSIHYLPAEPRREQIDAVIAAAGTASRQLGYEMRRSRWALA